MEKDGREKDPAGRTDPDPVVEKEKDVNAGKAGRADKLKNPAQTEIPIPIHRYPMDY